MCTIILIYIDGGVFRAAAAISWIFSYMDCFEQFILESIFILAVECTF